MVGGLVPAARLRSLEQALPGLTHGEGLLESTFAGYRPVTGPPPSRGHWDRKEYLLHVERRIALDS